MRRRTRKSINSNQIQPANDFQQQNPELFDRIQAIQAEISQQTNRLQERQAWQQQYLTLMQDSSSTTSKLGLLVRACYLRENSPYKDANSELNSNLRSWRPFIRLSECELQKAITYQSKLMECVLHRQVPVELAQYIYDILKDSPIRRQNLLYKQKNENEGSKSTSSCQTLPSFNSKKTILIITPKSNQFI